MNIAEPGSAFLTWAKTQSGIYGLIGGATAPRMHPTFLPQAEALPAVVYQVMSTDPEHHLRGPSGLANSRFRIRTYGQTRAQAWRLSEEIRLPLLQDGGRRYWGPLFVSGVILEAGPFDDFDIPRDASDQWRLAIVTDYLVSWRQPRGN